MTTGAIWHDFHIYSVFSYVRKHSIFVDYNSAYRRNMSDKEGQN
jgi:hypothetical protein